LSRNKKEALEITLPIRAAEKYFFFSVISILVLILAGCAGQTSRKCLLAQENISGEYLGAMNHLEEKKTSLATEMFRDILACDVDYSPAYSGLAIALAQRAARGYNIDGKSIIASRSALHSAKKHSSGPNDDFIRHLAAIRGNTIFKSAGWLTKVENEFMLAMKSRVDEKALPYYESSDAASYYIGNAYFDAGRIEDAMAEYEALIQADKNGKWGALAKRANTRSEIILSDIVKAVAAPEVVVLAFKRNITKADAAAIIMGELKLDTMLSSREIQMGYKGRVMPADITKNPYREEILKITDLGIKGLLATYSPDSSKYLFNPEKVLFRKDFAVILSDIEQRLSAGPSAFPLMRRTKRVFDDVPVTAPWYDAVMNITSLNILVPIYGVDFRPYDAIDGPDAFNAVMGLKEGLQPR